MDNSLTELIRREIALQYKSTRQFAMAVDIPLSTITSALKKGVDGMSFDSVVKICETLGIQRMSTAPAGFVSGNMSELLETYTQLDKIGRHTVDTVARVELMRCRGAEPAHLAAFGGGPSSVDESGGRAASARAVRSIRKKSKGTP